MTDKQLQITIENETARSLLDQLITDSKLYTQSKAYKELLDFVVRMRNFAPFNALLLQIQKPGLSFAASAFDWWNKSGRKPKPDARPLVILWPFGPVAFVYDVLDTEGKEIPESIWCFYGKGLIDKDQISSFTHRLKKKNIYCQYIDCGDRKAGAIRVVSRSPKAKEPNVYEITLNQNHAPAVQFATLAHELAHLFLGHLGDDKKLNVPQRNSCLKSNLGELEAESVAYLVCKRNGVSSNSESYLSKFVENNTTVDHIDIFQIMRAAGQIETILGITANTNFEKPRRAR